MRDPRPNESPFSPCGELARIPPPERGICPPRRLLFVWGPPLISSRTRLSPPKEDLRTPMLWWRNVVRAARGSAQERILPRAGERLPRGRIIPDIFVGPPPRIAALVPCWAPRSPGGVGPFFLRKSFAPLRKKCPLVLPRLLKIAPLLKKWGGPFFVAHAPRVFPVGFNL